MYIFVIYRVYLLTQIDPVYYKNKFFNGGILKGHQERQPRLTFLVPRSRSVGTRQTEGGVRPTHRNSYSEVR